MNMYNKRSNTKEIYEKKQKMSPAITKEERDLLKKNDDLGSKIILLLCYTGLRVSELCDLKWNDCNFEEEIITVQAGKGGKLRYIPILDYTKELLSELKVILNSKVYVLETSKGTKYQRQYINRLIKMVNVKYHPHIFRHTFASILNGSGLDINTISTLLGHSSIMTTMKVYIHPSIGDLKKGIKLLDK